MKRVNGTPASSNNEDASPTLTHQSESPATQTSPEPVSPPRDKNNKRSKAPPNAELDDDSGHVHVDLNRRRTSAPAAATESEQTAEPIINSTGVGDKPARLLDAYHVKLKSIVLGKPQETPEGVKKVFEETFRASKTENGCAVSHVSHKRHQLSLACILAKGVPIKEATENGTYLAQHAHFFGLTQNVIAVPISDEQRFGKRESIIKGPANEFGPYFEASKSSATKICNHLDPTQRTSKLLGIAFDDGFDEKLNKSMPGVIKQRLKSDRIKFSGKTDDFFLNAAAGGTDSDNTRLRFPSSTDYASSSYRYKQVTIPATETRAAGVKVELDPDSFRGSVFAPYIPNKPWIQTGYKQIVSPYDLESNEEARAYFILRVAETSIGTLTDALRSPVKYESNTLISEDLDKFAKEIKRGIEFTEMEWLTASHGWASYLEALALSIWYDCKTSVDRELIFNRLLTAIITSRNGMAGKATIYNKKMTFRGVRRETEDDRENAFEDWEGEENAKGEVDEEDAEF